MTGPCIRFSLLAPLLLPPLLTGFPPHLKGVELSPPQELVPEPEVFDSEAERSLADWHKYLVLHPEKPDRPAIELATVRGYLVSKDYERAKSELERALRSGLRPEETHQSLFLLGRVNYALRDFEEALKCFDRALVLTEDRAKRSETLFWQGECLYALGDPEGGQAKFLAALKASPDRFQRGRIAYLSGLQSMERGATQETEEALARALACHPYFLRRVRGIEGLPPEAISPLRVDGAAFSWSHEALYALGYFYHSEGRADRAIAAFTLIPRYFPGTRSSERANLALGTIWSLKEDCPLALSYLATVRVSDQYRELSSKALYLTGLCQYRLAELEKSVQTLKKLLSQFPGASPCQDGVLLLGEVQYELKDYVAARRAFRRFLTQAPESPKAEDAAFGLAWSYYREGNYTQAFYKFRDLIAQKPASRLVPSSEYMAGRSRFNLGQYAEAIAIFEGLVAGHPQDQLADDAQYLMGTAYLDLNDSTRAVVELEKVALLYPASPLSTSAQKTIGDICFARRHYRQAVSAYKALETLDTPSHLLDEARYQIERAYYRMGLYKSPLDVGRNFALKYPKSPRSPALQFEVAQYYFRGKRYSEAITEYDRVIKLFPWSTLVDQAREKVAESFLHLGDHQKAIQAYRELAQRPPPLGDRAQFQIAETYLTLEDFDSAIREFEKLVRKFPKSSHADASQYEIGLCYRKLKRPQEARISFEKLASSYPTSKFAGPAYLETARTYYEEGDLEGYVAALSLTVEKTQGRAKAEAFFLLGQVYSAEGELSKALKAYVSAAESYGDDLESAANALFEAGRCARAGKEYKTALTMFQRAAVLLTDPQKLVEVEREIAEVTSALSKQ